MNGAYRVHCWRAVTKTGALKIILAIGVLAMMTLAARGTSASAAGSFPIPDVAGLSFYLPPNALFGAGAYYDCRGRVDDMTTPDSMPVTFVCYSAASPAGLPPTTYQPALHHHLKTTVYESTGFFRTTVISCVYLPANPVSVRITMDAWLDKAGDPAPGTVTVLENGDPEADDAFCSDGTETKSDTLTLTPLAEDHNTDGDVEAGYPAGFDSCPDHKELGDDPMQGGLRDPFNPYDFYDVSGDGQVSLTLDILPVLVRWSPNPSQPYDAIYDRGPTIGPNSWNKEGPDGQISLTFDILGVILQWLHTCN